MSQQNDSRDGAPDEKMETARANGPEDAATPANPGVGDKAGLPDPDVTDPSTLPTMAEEIDEPVEETR